MKRKTQNEDCFSIFSFGQCCFTNAGNYSGTIEQGSVGRYESSWNVGIRPSSSSGVLSQDENEIKDHPVQESRVGRIFRQTDLNYSSWDARTADTNKLL